MGKDTTSLGDRMKGYENISRFFLAKRTPVIIRLDGKAFHTFTKGMKKPFDKIMQETMQETMLFLCENIQGCKLGYTQSDEITLLLVDYDTYLTDAWFGNNVQKMASVSASMATLAFNKIYREKVKELWYNEVEDEELKYCDTLWKKSNTAMFDSRVFSLSKEEVVNCFIWRQQDAVRNSIQSVAQSKFSPSQLEGVTMNQAQEKLFQEFGINWNDYPKTQKRGSCAIKDADGKWFIDQQIPTFTQDRNYIERYVYLD